MHIFVFLLLPSCSCQVSSSCHEEEPQRQGSEKTGFYSSCAAHSHSLETLSCQSYYETNQVPDSGLALPHPPRESTLYKTLFTGKTVRNGKSKKPPCNSEENVQDKCDSYTLHTAGFPLAAPWTSISPEQVTTGYQEEPGNPESCHSSFLSFSKTLGNHKPHLTQQRLSWICPRELSARHPGTPQSEREDKEMGLRVSWHSALGTSQERIVLARSWNLRSLHVGSRMCWET